MKINIIRLHGSHPAREPLDTALLLGIEFALDEKHQITVINEDGGVHLYSSAGRLKIIPRTANSILIEVTE